MSLVEAFRSVRVTDVSRTIRNGMPLFPGHPPVDVEAARTHERDGYFLQALALGEHTGSHADAPAHAVAALASRTIDLVPVRRFVTPYLILDLADASLGPGELATRDVVRDAERATGHTIEAGDAALIHFGWDVHYDEPNSWWTRNTPGLGADACSYLVDRGVGVVGSDTATWDLAMKDGEVVAAHGHDVYFLPNDIPILEGLVGLGAAPPRGILIAAPLKIAGGSGAPVRALLISERE